MVDLKTENDRLKLQLESAHAMVAAHQNMTLSVAEYATSVLMSFGLGAEAAKVQQLVSDTLTAIQTLDVVGSAQ